MQGKVVVLEFRQPEHVISIECTKFAAEVSHLILVVGSNTGGRTQRYVQPERVEVPLHRVVGARKFSVDGNPDLEDKGGENYPLKTCINVQVLNMLFSRKSYPKVSNNCNK